MIEIPDPSFIPSVADWIELSISISGERFSKAGVSSIIESIAGEEPAETFLSGLWRELSYRQQLYVNPCFQVQERTVEPQPDTQPPPEYVACLILSLFGVQGTTQLPAKLFERIASKAVKEYLCGNAVVFGWPFDPADNAGAEDEPQIKRKIKKVAEDLSEKFCESPPARFNDRGVDVVGWIPFEERRPGQVVVLLQCFAGRDWKNKLPVPLEAWCQYIHWGNNPVRAFAVPTIIPERDWHEGSTDKGILFDRPRIVNLVSKAEEDRELTEELRAWVDRQLPELEQ